MIEDARMNSRLAELQDALIGAGQEGDAAMALENEARLFAKQVVNLTPPKGMVGDAKKQGEQAVKRDLEGRLFTGVDEDFLNVVSTQFGSTGIDEWITSAVTKKPLHISWKQIDPSGQGMADFHNRNRDGRGRARRVKRSFPGIWAAPYVTSKEALSAYVEKIQSHVGRRKAAWAVSYKKLGGKVQRWIDRHIGGSPSECHINLVGTLPSVTMIARAPGISGDAHIIQSALRVRHEAMGRRIRLIMSGYAKDVKQGLRISKKERREE